MNLVYRQGTGFVILSGIHREPECESAGIYQIAMDLPRANPNVTGMVYGLMGASLFLAASIMPALVGAVIDAVGGLSVGSLRIVIALSGITALLNMACVALCPTGQTALDPVPRPREAQSA